MCGIIGLVRGADATLPVGDAFAIAEQLLLLSESRGKEAAGLAVTLPGSIGIVKKPTPASEFVRLPEYLAFRGDASRHLTNDKGGAFGLIGHARLVTNGLQCVDDNNQPVTKGRAVCVHNGIVVNDAELWRTEPGIDRAADVDTEIIAAMLDARLRGGGSISSAIRHVFSRIVGEASIAALFTTRDELLVATNTGSLFLAVNPAVKLSFVASELAIARALLKKLAPGLRRGFGPVTQIRAGEGATIDIASGALHQRFPLLSDAEPIRTIESPNIRTPRRVVSSTDLVRDRWLNLRRCSKCVLPETMPFIEFDSAGVCNYCRTHVPHELKGRDALDRALAPYRSRDGSPDCIIAFSGGRDSSYGLHLLKKELGMNPVAYTYDWGMVTDLARRNQARLCGQLGVEHIWVSADIKQKRRNVRKNVEAWLKRPELGMVPLFMAGDKQFMYHANRLMKETDIRLMVYANNRYEQTDFKAGFCGVRPSRGSIKVQAQPLSGKLTMAAYYAKNYLINPKYLNESLLDTFTAFLSYYAVNQDFLYLFDYLRWDEDTVNRTLLGEYDWELATDTPTTWRIGDGTAPFYNYIYKEVAGFNEYETFRSNQIREGAISRERALALLDEESVPRLQSIQEYCRTIGIDFDEAMKVINSIPKLY
jgi:hypothetical protein